MNRLSVVVDMVFGVDVDGNINDEMFSVAGKVVVEGELYMGTFSGITGIEVLYDGYSASFTSTGELKHVSLVGSRSISKKQIDTLHALVKKALSVMQDHLQYAEPY